MRRTYKPVRLSEFRAPLASRVAWGGRSGNLHPSHRHRGQVEPAQNGCARCGAPAVRADFSRRPLEVDLCRAEKARAKVGAQYVVANFAAAKHGGLYGLRAHVRRGLLPGVVFQRGQPRRTSFAQVCQYALSKTRRSRPVLRFRSAVRSMRLCLGPANRTLARRTRTNSSNPTSGLLLPRAGTKLGGLRRLLQPKRNTGAIRATSPFPSRPPSGCRGQFRSQSRPPPIPLKLTCRPSTSTASIRSSAPRPRPSAARAPASATQRARARGA